MLYFCIWFHHFFSLLVVSTTTAINPNVNSSVELFDAAFRREAGNMNTDWKMLGQIKIPKAVIKQVTGEWGILHENLNRYFCL